MSTIREVAAKAGVSVTTVSRTLNNRGYISKRTRQRIQDAMESLNYQPNEVARSLTFQHTRMIGVLVPEIESPFFAGVVSRLSRLLTDRGYKMLLYIASGTDDDAPDYISMLKSNQVDGVIIALRGKSLDNALLNRLPVVSFERLPFGEIPTVMCDNLQGGRLAAQELLDSGCVRPVMIGGRHATENIPAFERFRGYRETVEAAGCPVRIYEIREEECQGDYTGPVREAFQQYADADGFFCSSDRIAACALQEALRLGKRVPGDVRIVGFNDVLIPRLSAIPMTSVHQPLDKMCAAAVDCLLAQINGEHYTSDLLFPVEITRRASTRGYQSDPMTR